MAASNSSFSICRASRFRSSSHCFRFLLSSSDCTSSFSRRKELSSLEPDPWFPASSASVASPWVSCNCSCDSECKFSACHSSGLFLAIARSSPLLMAVSARCTAYRNSRACVSPAASCARRTCSARSFSAAARRSARNAIRASLSGFDEDLSLMLVSVSIAKAIPLELLLLAALNASRSFFSSWRRARYASSSPGFGRAKLSSSTRHFYALCSSSSQWSDGDAASSRYSVAARAATCSMSSAPAAVRARATAFRLRNTCSARALRWTRRAPSASRPGRSLLSNCWSWCQALAKLA